MSCRDESCHDDHHDHHGHDGHDHDGPDRGFEFSLFQHIDLPRVRCLNEAGDRNGAELFKPWDKRFDEAEFIESDADEQLILYVPFTGSVKLKSIAVYGEIGSLTNPSQMKVFINREDIDFDNVDSTEFTQEFELVRIDRQEVPEYPTKMAKFNGVRNLTMFFPANFGADVTKISYIGFKGEFTKLNKDPIITLYEAAANPADHPKTAAQEFTRNVIQ